MINCEKARELADGYIDGMLDEAQAVAYEEHISCCDMCHNEYDMLKKISVDLSKTVAPLPKGFEKRARNNFTKSKGKTIPLPYIKTASALAAALVIAAVGKFGVYDVYKSVTDKSELAAREIVDGRASDLSESSPGVGSDTSQKDGKKSDKPDEKPVKKVYVTPSPYEPATANDAVSFAENSPTDEETKPTEEETVSADTVEESSAEYGVAAVAEFSADSLPAADTGDLPNARMGRAAIGSGGSGGASAGTVPEAADSAPTAKESETTESAATELIPAGITLHHGDVSTEAFKKFLKTFLDDAAISETDGVITVTVDSARYDSVMAKIRSNEYVKSVSDGTPFGGIAVINILK